MPDAIIEVRGLTKTYTDFWGRPRVPALKPLDLRIQPGEVFGLLGPNGSGKTTTIKMLLGLCRPTAGEAFLLGREAGDRSALARIGYLPEETYLYRFLDAEETLRFIAGLFGLPAALARERADALIRQVGLDQARKRRVGEYSKGMARRLGLAQALINAPDLVILDEPTSGLDPMGSAEVKELIRALAAKGTTVLMSSHLLADVEDVCDRIAVLHQGYLLACGKVAELLRDDRRMTVELHAPSAETLAAVRAAAGDSLGEVTPPRQRLEDWFRALIQARSQR